MKIMPFFAGTLLLAGWSLSSCSAGAAEIFAAQHTTTALTYESFVSGVDLINSGQATLAGSVVDPTGSVNYLPTGINDGHYSNTQNHNTLYQIGSDHFPATAIYHLNTAINPLGYDIFRINSFMGWHANSIVHGNQIYTVDVRYVGDDDYTPLTSVNYAPFPIASETNGSGESFVSLTDSSGVLASGVDSIRFTFLSPSATGAFPGTVIKEIDVFGAATAAVPEPSGAAFLGAALGMAATLQLVRRRKNKQHREFRSTGLNAGKGTRRQAGVASAKRSRTLAVVDVCGNQENDGMFAMLPFRQCL